MYVPVSRSAKTLFIRENIAATYFFDLSISASFFFLSYGLLSNMDFNPSFFFTLSYKKVSC